MSSQECKQPRKDAHDVAVQHRQRADQKQMLPMAAAVYGPMPGNRRNNASSPSREQFAT